MAFDRRKLYLAAVRVDLKVFVLRAFQEIYPNKKFNDNWHIDAIVHVLEETIRGKRKRLLINLPPRHLKSFLTSVVLPAFLVGLDPGVKVICVSYSDELAKALSRDFRRIIESDWYCQVFVNVKSVKITETDFVTDKGGFRYATSIGGSLTGRGADFIIVDDPVKAEEAQSQKVREATNEWFRSTLISRLDDKENGVMLVVHQRLHVNDMTGYLHELEGFHKLSFPAIAFQDEEIELRHGKVYFRPEGQVLCPQQESLKSLKELQDLMGDYNFMAQYQQRPETPSGGMFKKRWLKVVDRLPEEDGYGQWYVSVDTALATSSKAHNSAISLIYADKSGYYVADAQFGRWEYEELVARLAVYERRYGRDLTFLIEKAGVGFSLINKLQSRGLKCFTYTPRDDKETRAAYAVPIFVAGRVHILESPGSNGWPQHYKNELFSFPHGQFDDQVDSLVQLLIWAERRTNPDRCY